MINPAGILSLFRLVLAVPARFRDSDCLASSGRLGQNARRIRLLDPTAEGRMKSYREELWFETKTRRAYLNITSQVQAAVQKSGVREGLVLVNAMHITASVYINDDEQGLLKDYEAFLERLAPQSGMYKHNETGEDNPDAHLERQAMGREGAVPVPGGGLDSGPGGQFFSGELAGGRGK